MLTAPLFLFGLLAIGIPIAIHLLQLRRYRRVYFSNVAMLQQLQSQQRQQHRLQQLLILAARILAIVFLVLAFCRPVIPSRHSQSHAGGTAVSVYIDNSYSMECGGMDGSLIESAKTKAREIAAAYGPGDQYQLLTNEAAGSQFRWLSREEFLAAVDQVSVSPRSVQLSTLALRQHQFLSSAPTFNRHAYIVSDFQRTTADLANYPNDSTVLSTFIPLGGTDVSNIFIDSLSFHSPAYFRGATVRATVTLTNLGKQAVEKLPIRLFVGDQQRALASVDMPANGSATAQLTFVIEEAESLQGYVETTDYPITFDDKLYFSLPVLQQVSLLCISGNGENPFLRRLFATDSLVDYHQVPASQVDYARLSSHQIIILDQLHTISTGMIHTLQEFVQQGGSLVMIPGQQIESAAYNQLLAAMHAPLLGDWSSDDTRVKEVVTDHELFRGVFSGPTDDMELPSVHGHYRTSHAASAVSRPILPLLDGSTLLAHTPCGLGSFYLFSTPLLAQFTDFVQQALFVPTLYNMALFASPLPAPYNLLSASSPIPLSAQLPAGAVPHLISSDGLTDIIPDIRRIGPRQVMMPHDQIIHAGNYHLAVPNAPGEVLSFNHSRQESQLTFFAPAEVKQLIRRLGLDQCSVVPSAQKSMSDYIRQRHQGVPLWRWCVVFALISLLAEVLLIRLPFTPKKYKK